MKVDSMWPLCTHRISTTPCNYSSSILELKELGIALVIRQEPTQSPTENSDQESDGEGSLDLPMNEENLTEEIVFSPQGGTKRRSRTLITGIDPLFSNLNLDIGGVARGLPFYHERPDSIASGFSGFAGLHWFCTIC